MLYSYKMVVDSGFAPNPFYGYLTLATCKPYIRMTKKEGDYIAGFTSAKLEKKYSSGFEKLIYIMKVTQKMSYAEYHEDPKFKKKIPSEKSPRSRAGDNIYKLKNSCYVQLGTRNHANAGDIRIDMQCREVLISNQFFYFGSKPISIDRFGIKKPKFQSAYGVRTIDRREIEKLWRYLEGKYKKNHVYNEPHNFDHAYTDKK